MVDTVSIDLWFTLVYEDNDMYNTYLEARIHSIYSVAKDYRDDISYEDIKRMYYELRHVLMTTSPEKLIRYFIYALGIEEEAYKYMLKDYVNTAAIVKPMVNKEAGEFLDKLKSLGLKTVLVTNTSFSSDMVRVMLDNIGLSKYIDYIVSSADLGVGKPNKEIFHEAVKVSGSKEGVIHVGDKYMYDVVGALNAGLDAILYTGLWDKYKMFQDFSRDYTEFNFPPYIKVAETLGEAYNIIERLIRR